jgi:hypothetical protein
MNFDKIKNSFYISIQLDGKIRIRFLYTHPRGVRLIEIVRESNGQKVLADRQHATLHNQASRFSN